jgi:hypothetical protein
MAGESGSGGDGEESGWYCTEDTAKPGEGAVTCNA